MTNKDETAEIQDYSGSRPASSTSQRSNKERSLQNEDEQKESTNMEDSTDHNGSGDEGFESDEQIPPPKTVVDDIKEILLNLSDDGIDRLMEMIPDLTDQEVNFLDKNQNGWLHWLAVSKHLGSVDQNRLVSVIMAFSAVGINYNKRNLTKNTALHFAVACKAPLRMINAFLKIGMDPSFKNDKNRTARQCTADRTIIKTLEMFSPPLDESIKSGETEKVEDLLSYWVKITNYHADIAKRQPAIREQLLEHRQRIEVIHRALTGNPDSLLDISEELLEDIINLSDCSYMTESGDVVPLPLLFLLITNPYCYDCAKIILERGCDVNFPVSYRGDGMMVPFWIWFKTTDHPRKEEFIPLIQANIDYTASVNCISHDYMLDFLNSNREIFDHLVEKGYEFWQLNKNMRNLFDLAIYNSLKANKEKLDVSEILANLEVLDDALLPFFTKWDDDKLQLIQDAGYWPLISFRTLRKLQKSKDKDDVKFAWRLKGLHEKWSLFRKLRDMIQLGNTSGFRELMNSDVCERSDKLGHTLIHYAVIYERRFILKHILDKKPSSVDNLDHNGRTALHYSQGIEEEFIYNLLDRAGADRYLPDKSVNINEIQRSSMYPILSDAAMIQSFYRQAIRVERKETTAFSHYLLLLYLSMYEAVELGDEDNFKFLFDDLWVDLNWDTFSKVNKMFPNQPHKLPNLITFCIQLHREEFGRDLLKNGHPLDSEVRTSDGVFMVEEYARKEGLDQLADDIEQKKNASKKSTQDDTNYSDEGETIFSVDTANSVHSQEDEHRHGAQKEHKKKHGHKKTGGKKKKKKSNNNKVEDSEVCTIL